MKKQLTLMIALLIGANVHAEVTSTDQKIYVELLLKQSKHCMKLALTRKERNISSKTAAVETEMCEKVTALLAQHTLWLNSLVEEAATIERDKNHIPTILFGAEYNKLPFEYHDKCYNFVPRNNS